jgi:hypothetical protein
MQINTRFSKGILHFSQLLCLNCHENCLFQAQIQILINRIQIRFNVPEDSEKDPAGHWVHDEAPVEKMGSMPVTVHQPHKLYSFETSIEQVCCGQNIKTGGPHRGPSKLTISSNSKLLLCLSLILQLYFMLCKTKIIALG